MHCRFEHYFHIYRLSNSNMYFLPIRIISIILQVDILLIYNQLPITIYEEDRKEYYNVLEKFDEELELNNFVVFF